MMELLPDQMGAEPDFHPMDAGVAAYWLSLEPAACLDADAHGRER